MEEGRSERPEEISECTEEVWGTDDQEEIVLEGKEKGSEVRNRKVSRSDSSKHLVHYNEAWEREFAWLVPKKEGDKVIHSWSQLKNRRISVTPVMSDEAQN